ncbi:MAG: OmpA family protein [Elusimicrobiota bacterium]
MALKKPPHRIEEETDDWMLTYADMVTLLFTFFVVLFSISNPDLVKIQLLSNYFSQDKKMTFTELQQKIEEYIVDNEVQHMVTVKLTSKGVEINFKDKVLFDMGNADLKNAAYPILTEISDLLKYEEISDRKISVEGHTDSVPIKSAVFPSNWELSSARAAGVVKFFISKGMNKQRFQSIGFADTRPLVEESDAVYGQPKNRRVVVVISPSSYMEDIGRKEIDISKASGGSLKRKLKSETGSRSASVKNNFHLANSGDTHGKDNEKKKRRRKRDKNPAKRRDKTPYRDPGSRVR